MQIKIFLASLLACLMLDSVWLGFVAKNIYFETIGSMLRKSGNSLSPNYPAALIVYLLLVGGIILFVLPKTNGSYGLALLWGALFGAVTYGIYDFTNFAIFSSYPFKITLIDFGWGIVLCSLVTLFATYLQNILR
jgi:uncharacterized membrane protein